MHASMDFKYFTNLYLRYFVYTRPHEKQHFNFNIFMTAIRDG